MRYFWRDLLINTCLAIGFIALSLWHPLVAAALLSCTLIYILIVEWPAFHRWGLAFFYPTLPFLLLIGGIVAGFFIDFAFYQIVLGLVALAWLLDGVEALLEHLFDTQRPWVQQKTRQHAAWWLRFIIIFMSALKSFSSFKCAARCTAPRLFTWETMFGDLMFAACTAFILHCAYLSSARVLERLKRKSHLTSTGSFLGTSRGLLDRFGSVLLALPYCIPYGFVVYSLLIGALIVIGLISSLLTF